jgi:ABC-2 type transport system permease protein
MLSIADLDGWARISPWYYYSGGSPLANGIDYSHVALLAALAAASAMVGRLLLVRRDLKG